MVGERILEDVLARVRCRRRASEAVFGRRGRGRPVVRWSHHGLALFHGHRCDFDGPHIAGRDSDLLWHFSDEHIGWYPAAAT